ncbi:MAG: magnesium/cobalt transporter CorA [Geminicoccales bacterium]
MKSKRQLRYPIPRSRRRSPPGAPPGSIVVHEDALPSRMNALAYGPDDVASTDDVSLDAIPALLKRWPVVWIDVSGLGTAETIEGLGRIFRLHSLALEDVINVHQRPKVEDYADFTFIVCNMLHAEPALATEQVSIFVGERFVVTFQERPGDCFGPIRERIRHGRGRLRKEGPDYLAYALIDSLVDGYFAPVERYGDLIENLELAVVERANKAVVGPIHAARRDLFLLRKTIWAQREMLAALSRDPYVGFTETTQLFLRDCYDHAVQLLDMTETYRDFATNLFELYLSTVSNRMNEVMKVLTIIATIFMPLSFIASIYGMNFNAEKSPWNMPELDWYFGYPFALLLMALVAAVMLVMFWRKGWLGGDR